MTIGSNSEKELAAIIERAERIIAERDKLSEDLKAVYAEAKVTGFDPKVIRKVIGLRKIDLEERREQRDVFDTYAKATNLYGDSEEAFT